MAPRIRRLTSASDEGVDALVSVYQADSIERDPADPVPSRSRVLTDMFDVPPDRRRPVFIAEVDGEPAGFANAIYETDRPGEIRLAEIELFVVERFRREGIARALIASLVPALAAEGQTSVIAYACTDVWPEESVGLCIAHGMTFRMEERCSRAIVDEVDTELLAGWEDAAQTAASGYRIEQWEGPCPPHLLSAWCEAAAAMQDAPLDDMDYEPHVRTPQQRQQADEIDVGRGYRLYRTLALTDDGEPAGLSTLSVASDRPEIGHQGDTGVLAAHRGHGIGRWLKAANFRNAVAGTPELQAIETYNAESNPWMLAINVAMGFQPYHTYAAYQAPIEMVLTAVEASAQARSSS